jgi:hypothetical protein
MSQQQPQQKKPTLPIKFIYVEHGKDMPFHEAFPEYNVIHNALQGGYSWYDLMHDRGRHLLEPKYIPKLVHVSKEELVVIKKKQAEEEKRAREEERLEQEKRVFRYGVEAGVKRIQQNVAAMEPSARTKDALVDYVSSCLLEYPQEYQDPILETVCPLIEPLIYLPEEEQCEKAVNDILGKIRNLDVSQREIQTLATFVAHETLHYDPVLHSRITERVGTRVREEGLTYEATAAILPPLPPNATLVSRRVVMIAPVRNYDGWLSPAAAAPAPAPAPAPVAEPVVEPTIAESTVLVEPMVCGAIPLTAPSSPATPQPPMLPPSPSSTQTFTTAEIDNEDLSSFVTALEGDDDAWGIPRLDLSAPPLPPSPPPSPPQATDASKEAFQAAFVAKFTHVLAEIHAAAPAPAPAPQSVVEKFQAAFQSFISEKKEKRMPTSLLEVQKSANKPKTPKMQKQKQQMSRDEARRLGRIRKAERVASAATATAAAKPVETKPLFDIEAIRALPVIQTKLVKAPASWRAAKITAPRSKTGGWYYTIPGDTKQYGPLSQSQMADWILAVYFD